MSERVLVRVAGTVTALLLALLLFRLLDIVRAMEGIADYVSPLVMGHNAYRYPGSVTQLGNYAWYNGFWASRAISWLPRGDELAAVLPMLITIGVIAAMARQARRLWGGVAALVLAAFALAMGGEAWIAAASWSVHYATWWGMAAAGMTVVAATGGQRRAARAGAAITILWGGLALAGDAYGFVVIVGPLAAVVLTCAQARAWPVAIRFLGLIAATLVSAIAFKQVAQSAHLIKHFFPVDPVSFELLGKYAGLTLDGILHVWGPFGPVLFASAVSYFAAVILIGAAGAVPTVLSRGSGLGERTWTVFWTVAALGCVGAFMVNTTSNSDGSPVLRYLYVLPLAGPALLAAAAGSGIGRRAALVGVSVVAAGAAYGLLAHPPVRAGGAHGPAQGNVLEAARRYGLARGYGSYATAYAMERALRFQVHILPVEPCANKPGVCPFYLHRFDDAYDEQPGTRTFLLVDHSPYAAQGGFEWVQTEPVGAKPVRRLDMGDGLEMLIYDHDVARDFGPLPPLNSA